MRMDAEMQRRAKLAIAVVLIVGAIWYLQAGQKAPAQDAQAGGNGGDGLFGTGSSTSNAPVGPRIGNRAPEFVPTGEWFNTAPLKMSGLRGKVVLVDFWTYTCINCLRTLPYLNSWHEKYADKGLMIVGVHTPEFNFERDAANVRQAITDQGIGYAVVQDNDYLTWRAWENRYWPRKFLVDKDGIVRYDHIGEGGYEETEAMIVRLLAEAGENVSSSFDLPDVERENLERTTPELYAGYWRPGALGNIEGYYNDEAHDYAEPTDVQLHRFYLNGKWTIREQHLQYSGAPSQGYVALSYYAMSVNAVLRPAGDDGKAFNATVLLDGKPIARDDAGRDVEFAADGKAYVQVDADRLYNIVRTKEYGAHVVSLVTDSDEFGLYAYTFG